VSISTFIVACHRSLEIEIVMHCENLESIKVEQSQDDEYSQIEIVLRTFRIAVEAHFLKQWLKRCGKLMRRSILNYIEDWEAAAISSNWCVGKFKLQNKYIGVWVYDHNVGDDPCNEVQQIFTMMWDQGTKTLKANTE
jgi:hypothetical protein